MKRKHSIIIIILVVAAIPLSCQKNNVDSYLIYPTALVTVKPNADNSSFYLQLDDKTALMPVNIVQSPFGIKEVRALTNFGMRKKVRESLALPTNRYMLTGWIPSSQNQLQPTSAQMRTSSSTATIRWKS